MNLCLILYPYKYPYQVFILYNSFSACFIVPLFYNLLSTFYHIKNTLLCNSNPTRSEKVPAYAGAFSMHVEPGGEKEVRYTFR